MMRPFGLRAGATVCFAFVIAGAAIAQQDRAPEPSSITIAGAVSSRLMLSLADIEKMPQTTIRVVNPHSQSSGDLFGHTARYAAAASRCATW
jgi:hypothetical protein